MQASSDGRQFNMDTNTFRGLSLPDKASLSGDPQNSGDRTYAGHPPSSFPTTRTANQDRQRQRIKYESLGKDFALQSCPCGLRPMSSRSKIEWTDATWNPVRGCTKISPGCKFCYAEVFAERFRGVPGHAYEQGFDLRLAPDKLFEPLRWKSPKMIFVNSMSDLFHREVSDAYILAVAKVMHLSTWHVFQVLTKRADRMVELLSDSLKEYAADPHIWWGVSVEDRKHGLPRIDTLRRAAAAVRFLSIEPLLENLGQLDLTRIDWAIVGGESGRHARPMNPEWVRSIRDQCLEAQVPFFFKQWGGSNKKRNGRLLDGRTYDAFPEIARSRPPSRTDYDALVISAQEVALQLQL